MQRKGAFIDSTYIKLEAYESIQYIEARGAKVMVILTLKVCHGSIDLVLFLACKLDDVSIFFLEIFGIPS